MSTAVVVDTNVPVVANGNSPQASPECVISCVLHLNRIVQGRRGKLVVDDQWRILREYQNNLSSSGQPGVGDAFLKWVLTNRANPKLCDLVSVAGHEFPPSPELSGFDPSDRVFVIVALAHARQPPVLQAVDVKWWKFRNALQNHGVTVEFLCEAEIGRLLPPS